tara:strand:- start:697 stop:1227 length:531 start_codon:yes stop_codon:yes gene_type:complete
MKKFKTLFIPKVDYTDVPHHKDGYYCRMYKRKRYSLTIHNYADEARLIEEVKNKILKQCGWLVQWLRDNAKDIARLRPFGTPSDKVNGTKLSLAVGRVAKAKVLQDWADYGTEILQLNSYYIYALELYYKRECGYVDPLVVVGGNKYGWRVQSFNPEGKFVAPNNRPFGRYQVSDK